MFWRVRCRLILRGRTAYEAFAIGKKKVRRRSVAAISLAIWRARLRSPGPQEMAETLACPPPPYFSAQRSEIHFRGRFLPGIRAHRNLGPRRRGAHAHRIKRVGKQEIRNELVVAFKVQIADVEIDHAAAGIGALPKNIDRMAMAFEQRARGDFSTIGSSIISAKRFVPDPESAAEPDSLRARLRSPAPAASRVRPSPTAASGESNCAPSMMSAQ